ncbi:MAG: DUF86 domain-containing protein [Ardenticatenales bacterium]|nr:DUF86 domain-containing protein [Ardenticatenales bacterium]
MRLDPDFLRARALDVRRHVELARGMAAMNDDAFMADERTQYALAHVLLVAIESAAAMCTHVSARALQRAPDSYVACIDELVAADILEVDLAAKLRAMMRFRNVLVHQYWDIDMWRVLGYAREHVDDLEAFVDAIGLYVAESL